MTHAVLTFRELIRRFEVAAWRIMTAGHCDCSSSRPTAGANPEGDEPMERLDESPFYQIPVVTAIRLFAPGSS